LGALLMPECTVDNQVGTTVLTATAPPGLRSMHSKVCPVVGGRGE